MSGEHRPRHARSWLPANTGAAIRTAVAREPGLAVVGAVGVVAATVCLAAVAVRGRFIPPEGKVLDAATFCFGVGVFTLTVALLLPWAGYTQIGRRRWRRAFYVFVVYGLAVESIQTLRGLDPRFTDAGGTADDIAGGIFGLTAALNVILFVLLGLRFFRPDVLADRPALRLGIRYGTSAVALSFAVGIVMSINAGREIGDDGNLLLSHALGVHGIQALPAVALLAAAAGTVPHTMTWLHVAGVGWLGACTAALVQAVLGQPPLEASAVTAAIVAGVLAWSTVTGYFLLMWHQAGPTLAPGTP